MSSDIKNWNNLSQAEKINLAKKNDLLVSGNTPAGDATTIEDIWSMLSVAQRKWVEQLTVDERKVFENNLRHYGEKYAIKYWKSFVSDLEHYRNL